MRKQINLVGDVTYDGNGNPIEVNGQKIAKGGASTQTKTFLKKKIAENIFQAALESAVFKDDYQEKGEVRFFRGASNDYLIEVTAKKDNDTPRAIMIAAGGSVSEYAAGLTRIAVKTLNGVDRFTVLWAEGNKVRVSTPAGDFEIKIVKKRDRI